MPNIDQKPSHLVVDPDSPDPGATREPMTEEQTARLKALCEKSGEPFDKSLTQAQAAERIEVLEARLA
jgi:hypothetical protein